MVTVSELRVVLTGDNRDLNRSLDDADRKTGSFARSAKSTMRSVTLAAGSMAVAMGGAAVNAAIQWESAFADVRKTVDGTPADLAAVEAGIRALATSDVLGALPNAHAELAQIAATAGQLGIRSNDIVDFTETIGALTVATDLSGEEAARFAARFANITGMPVADVRQMGDALVYLGNNFAANESEIAALANRLGTLANFEFDPVEILGYSAAIAALGISAELGGSNFVKSVQEMTTAVSEGGPKLDTYAATAGMTADEFTRLAGTDPSEAMNDFLTGLGEMDASEQIATLAELGITGSEQIRVLTTMANSMDTVTDALETAEEGWNGSGAAMQEATNKADTTAGKMENIRNRVRDIGITLGNAFLPGISDLADGLAMALDAIAQLPTVLTVLMDQISRAWDRKSMELRASFIEFAAGFRMDILNATGGRIDIAPDIAFSQQEINEQIRMMDIADSITAGLRNQVAAGEGIDLSSIFFQNAAGMQFGADALLGNMAMNPQLPEGFGQTGRMAVEAALQEAINFGDEESIQLLTPLALELGIDMDAVQTELVGTVEGGNFAADPFVNLNLQAGAIHTAMLQSQIQGAVNAMDLNMGASVNSAVNVIGPAAPASPGSGILGPLQGLIPQMHSGGMFRHRRGEGLALLRDGEVVTPPEQVGRGGNTIIINPLGQAPYDVAREIERAQRDMAPA